MHTSRCVAGVAAMLLFFAASAALAVGYLWTNGSGAGDWFTPTNWDPEGIPGSVPGRDDSVWIDTALPGEVNYPVLGSTQSAIVTGLCVSSDMNETHNTWLTVKGNLIDTGDWLVVGNWWMGDANTPKGTLIIDDGNVNMTGDNGTLGRAWFGYRNRGDLIVNGGMFSLNQLELGIGDDCPCSDSEGTPPCAAEAPGHSFSHLNAGTIEVRDYDAFTMRNGYPSCGFVGAVEWGDISKTWLDIRNGTMIINGNETYLVRHYRDEGWMTAYAVGTVEDGNIASNERAELVIDYDWRSPEKTTVTAYQAEPNQAYNLKPEPYTDGIIPLPVLTWKPGDKVAYGGTGQKGNGHHVFLHTNKTWVDFANLSYPVGEQFGHIIGAQDSNSFSVAENMCGPLHLSTTYYWRVLEANDGNVWKSQVQAFRTLNGGCSSRPFGGSKIAAQQVNLLWCTSGLDESDLYFGEDFNDVNSATVSNPKGVYLGRQSEPNYTVSGLQIGKTYYWRPDVIDRCGNIYERGYVTWFVIVSPCDFNHDDIVNFKDLARFAEYWMNDCGGIPSNCHLVDISPPFAGDDRVDMSDLDVFADCWLWMLQ